MIESFEIQDKDICLVTDSGTNMISASKKLNLPNYNSIAHKIYRLITHDFLTDTKMTEIKELIDKLSQIQKAILYKHDEMAQLEAEKQNENMENYLLECVKYGNLLNDKIKIISF